MIRMMMSNNADEDLDDNGDENDEVNDEVSPHPLANADHQDSGAAVQCIPVNCHQHCYRCIIIVTIFIRLLFIDSNLDKNDRPGDDCTLRSV